MHTQLYMLISLVNLWSYFKLSELTRTFYIFILCLWLLCLYVCALCVQYLWKPEEGIRSPALSTAMSCHMVAGNWICVLWNSCGCFYLLSSVQPHKNIFKHWKFKVPSTYILSINLIFVCLKNTIKLHLIKLYIFCIYFHYFTEY